MQQPGAKHEIRGHKFWIGGAGTTSLPAGDDPDLTASPLAISSAEIISQQIYSTEVSKILINDLMKLLKQDELDGFASSLLGLPDGRNFTGLAGSLLLI